MMIEYCNKNIEFEFKTRMFVKRSSEKIHEIEWDVSVLISIAREENREICYFVQINEGK